MKYPNRYDMKAVGNNGVIKRVIARLVPYGNHTS